MAKGRVRHPCECSIEPAVSALQSQDQDRLNAFFLHGEFPVGARLKEIQRLLGPRLVVVHQEALRTVP
eukprot:CAMPEP_0117610988 /NCGR_PEP_ID=MMETSP0784-20121206/82161_1 /TAXON_ID=39447 /ORGANISM="" /LENGTH=67 /DNA_ID=CAMNT_0005414417 /DNA_START=70 /DNA_END=270 /DNA_ORIENTATION=-